MGIIYALHPGDFNFRYVGATKRSSHRRLIEHRYEARSKRQDKNFYSGWADDPTSLFIFTLENNLGDAMLPERERYWIRELHSTGYDLLNISAGGGMQPMGSGSMHHGRTHSDVTRAKISASNSGKRHWSYGKKSIKGSVTEEAVSEVMNLLILEAYSQGEIAKMVGVSRSTVERIYMDLDVS